MSSPIKIFIAYSRKDSNLMEKLRTHLRPLERAKMAKIWYDGIIEAGKDWEKEIKTHLHAAEIILLLISADFMDSDYCYDKEMMDALEKHQQSKAQVIPIILRPCAWKFSPFAKLQVLPTDGKPVIEHEDYAFTEIVESVGKICQSKISQQKSLGQTLNDILSENKFSDKKEQEKKNSYLDTPEKKKNQSIAYSILSSRSFLRSSILTKDTPFTDSRDGQIYKTVKLKNGKIWMAENLKIDVGEGSYCYNNDPSLVEKFGRLYTWTVAKNACPDGWKIPSNKDWQQLVDFHNPKDGSYILDINNVACKNLMKSGVNNFGAKIGGCRDEDKKYNSINKYGLYWASNPSSEGYNSSWIFSPDSDLGIYGDEERNTYALSIRCIKDE